MKAVQVQRTGGPEVLRAVELPAPVPAENEVLVRAHAIGVSMPEVLVRRGDYAWMPPLPFIPGIEMSGTVAAKGAGVRSLEAGHAVYVSARELAQRGGCYAEYIAVPADTVFALPGNVDLDEAATLSAYQVAWHLLNTATRGFVFETVLVPGAAGGVGSALVQLAVLAGKRVIAAVGSEDKRAFALAQGAAVALDRRDPDLAHQIHEATGGRGVDLILDPVGGPGFGALFAHLAPLGLVVLYGYLQGWPNTDILSVMQSNQAASPALRAFSMHSLDRDAAARRAATRQLLALLERGAIRPVIHRRLPLASAAEAHRLLESGAVIGKLVLKP